MIAGREEARLIYAGAAHSVPASAGKRLVVDIGGGSTEFIIGTHYTPIHMESLYIGCVSHSRQFFAAGNVDEYTMRQAELAAEREIQIISAEYKQTGWDQAIGSSGTARAMAELVEANGFNDPHVTHGISRGGLERLKRALIKAENVNRLKLHRAQARPRAGAGRRPLDHDRACSTSWASITSIRPMARCSLGVLYDLLGRSQHRGHAHGHGGRLHAPLWRRRRAGRAHRANWRSTSTTSSTNPTRTPPGESHVSRVGGGAA